MTSVLVAAKPSRRNTLRAPTRIWSRFALALGPSSSDVATNELSCRSKLNSTVLLCDDIRSLSRVGFGLQASGFMRKPVECLWLEARGCCVVDSRFRGNDAYAGRKG